MHPLTLTQTNPLGAELRALREQHEAAARKCMVLEEQLASLQVGGRPSALSAPAEGAVKGRRAFCLHTAAWAQAAARRGAAALLIPVGPAGPAGALLPRTPPFLKQNLGCRNCCAAGGQ